MHVNTHCKSWRQKYDQERSQEDLKYKRPHNRNSAHVDWQSKSDSDNNRSEWKHFKIT